MRPWVFFVIAACSAPGATTADQAVTAGSDDVADPAVFALVDPTGAAGCTATAIGPHTAITAAHCVAGFDPRVLRGFFGSAVTGAGTFDQVTDGKADPAYDPVALEHDVGMITLRDPIAAAPVMLDPGPFDSSLVGTLIEVVGFGTTTGSGGDGGTKRSGTAQISDVSADELTAVPMPSQPCRGDSGGPALLGSGTIAGVVSHGDTACADHAVYARVDVERASFIDPYIAATAAGTVHVGDACFYDGQCDDGPCLVTLDDPELAFCGSACVEPGDCPIAMACESGECRYPLPSPGALGSPCMVNGDCTSQTCLESVCTRSCAGSAACPAGYACGTSTTEGYCFAAPGGGCGCSGGRPDGAWLIGLVLVLWPARRSRRRA